jgi:hypothetical protein
MNRLGFIVLFLLLLGITKAQDVTDKKLIEWGWDSPTPEFMRDNVTMMEQQPFDGVVFRLRKSPAYGAFEIQPLSEADMKLEILSAISWQRFDSNFLRLWSTASAGMDWFNDEHWNTITANLKLYAKAVNAAKAKGIVFDVEPYEQLGANPWAFMDKAGTRLYPEKSLEEVQARVRQRGAQFMEALQSEKPDITLLCSLLLGAARNEAEHYYINKPEKRTYALLPAFVDGMLDVIGPEVTMVDGRIPYKDLAGTYYFDDTRKFAFAYDYVRGASTFVSPENREKYSQQVQVGHALYTDYTLGQSQLENLDGKLPEAYRTWQDDYFQQWWQHNVYESLASSDQYVYLFTETMSWWGPEAHPKYPTVYPGAVEGVQLARDKLLRGEPLGFSMVKPDETLWDKNQQAAFVVRSE